MDQRVRCIDHCGRACPSLVLVAWRRLRHLDRDIGELDKEVGLLHGVPMFQPLPLPAIEQLVRGLEPVHVPARQGDPADRFYVIEAGAADVVGDGRLVTTLGPGEGFGEIALLRRVPRTAMVRAATDLRAAGTRVRPLSASCYGIPAELAGSGGRGGGDARPIQPG